MEKENPDVAEYYNKKKANKIVTEDTRTEEEKVKDKIHYDADGDVAFPAAGFSGGMYKVAYGMDKNMGMKVKESVRFLEPMIKIKYKSMEIAEHVGKIQGKTPRKILRPQFNDWCAVLPIKYDKDVFSAEQIINLIDHAGVKRGLGAYRPERRGEYGQYEVDTNE